MVGKINPLLKSSESYRNAGLVSKLFFWYAFRFFRERPAGRLEIGDIEPNLEENDSKLLENQVSEAFRFQIDKGTKNPLRAALWKVFRFQIVFLGILCLLKDGVLTMAQNLLLGYFIRSFTSTRSLPDQYALGISLVVTIFVQLVSAQSATNLAMQLAMKIRVALSALIYRKVLLCSQRSIDETGIGKITNFLASDAAIFTYALQFIHYIWIAPIVTFASAALIWSYVGLAAISGVGFTILLTPLIIQYGKWSVTIRRRIAPCTDTRLTLLNSLFNGISVIKMYTWEAPFVALVGKARDAEIKLMLKRAYLNTGMQSLLQVVPKIALFLSLLFYVLQGNPLDAETAFVSVSIFSMIAALITALLPAATGLAAEMLVGISRIESFLQVEEKADSRSLTKRDTIGVSFSNVSAKWSSDNGTECLHQISFDLYPGKLVCVVGGVGTGKTCLLLTALQETHLTSGTVLVQGRIAYTSQISCLFPGSIRDNIVFGSNVNNGWYHDVIRACALDRDFELLPHGDLTLVADKGATLSGGQKARISLARAVYSKADIYLLDDPLSAVDSTVASHIYTNCILGLLKSKCIIVTTHSFAHTRHAQEVIVLDQGRIKHRGTYDEVHGYDVKTMTTVDDVTDDMKDKDEEDIKEEISEKPETMASGMVNSTLIWKYLRFGNSIPIVCIAMVLSVGNQLIISFSDLYLQIWISIQETVSNVNAAMDQRNYVIIYSILMVFLLIFPILRTLAHYLVCVRSAKQLHSVLTWAVTRAPLSFFWTTSVGRIQNRASKDMGVVDEQLQQSLYLFIGMLLQSLGSLALICLMNPILVLPAILLLLATNYVLRIYLKPASEIVRLESIYKSPVFAHMSSSIHGLYTIRAYKAEPRFTTAFDSYQNVHSSVNFAVIVTARWFGTVIQLMTFTYFLIVSISYILADAAPSAVGLAISSNLGIASIFSVLLAQAGNLGTQLVCVERILEYTKIKPEQSHPKLSHEVSLPIKIWPSEGLIQFQDATVSYIPGKDVLMGITCVFRPQEKVGIVGRTGAGKSTLVAALFRLFDLKLGSIRIDGVDISRISLNELRSKLSIIPQDPIFFGATLRQNLDPFNEHEDVTIYEALQDTNLLPRIQELGLDTLVAENGSNFSQGEQQLISLARALLKKTKILILDEATAHVDGQTDMVMQKLVKEKFRFCTVLTIAHRLETILDSDRVCVMEAGKIVEFDTPTALLGNSNSRLSGFVKKASLKKHT